MPGVYYIYSMRVYLYVRTSSRKFDLIYALLTVYVCAASDDLRARAHTLTKPITH